MAQVPLIESRYIFPEHYFHMTPLSVAYLGDRYGVSHEYNIDHKNGYMTFILKKEEAIKDTPLLPNGRRMKLSLDPKINMMQSRTHPLLVREELIAALNHHPL